MPGNWWSEEELGLVKTNYPVKHVAAWSNLIPGRTIRAIRNKAERLQLIKEPTGRRRYQVDDYYFSVIAPTRCYWAGFLAADGWITDENEVCLSIQVHDLEHLEKYRLALGIESPIYHESHRVTLRFVSSKMCQDLRMIYNITPRKSLTLTPPQLDNEICVVAFLAGLLDGDGSIYGRWFQFLGTKAMMAWTHQWISCWAGGQVGSVTPKGKIYRYVVGFGRAIEFSNRVKEANLPVLDRKWSRVRKMRNLHA